MWDDGLICSVVYMMFFCFKQKTAYEMRISDWSSDVCSSDPQHRPHVEPRQQQLLGIGEGGAQRDRVGLLVDRHVGELQLAAHRIQRAVVQLEPHRRQIGRARVGKACVSTCRSRWAPYHEQNTN